jgi:hypothetical protein
VLKYRDEITTKRDKMAKVDSVVRYEFDSEMSELDDLRTRIRTAANKEGKKEKMRM